MERKIGETFEFEGKKIEVKAASNGCDGCFLKEKCYIDSADLVGTCGAGDRTDKKHVVFVEVQEQPQEQTEPQQGQIEPQKLNLCEILKDCPKGTILWSDNYGEVRFLRINIKCETPIEVKRTDGCIAYYTKEGWHSIRFPASCLLWPSKDCCDWSKFTAPWYKKERFDPKTLKPFDRVIVKNIQNNIWHIQYFSHINEKSTTYQFFCLHASYAYCIPYNDDTKHLVGTKDEAPEYYRY